MSLDEVLNQGENVMFLSRDQTFCASKLAQKWTFWGYLMSCEEGMGFEGYIWIWIAAAAYIHTWKWLLWEPAASLTCRIINSIHPHYCLTQLTPCANNPNNNYQGYHITSFVLQHIDKRLLLLSLMIFTYPLPEPRDITLLVQDYH